MAAADNNLSEPLSLFIKSLSSSHISSKALTIAQRSTIDTIGVMLAGLEEEPARLASELFRLHGGQGPSSIYKSGLSASPMDAAMVHGTAAHALDFDDTSPAINGHPSVSMVPALLSLSETKKESGLDFLIAYIAGYETQSLIAEPIRESHYSAGWHTTATLGVFGATAATAKLLDLSSNEIENALNIAASMASGLKSNFGSMTKPFHAGHAARSGLTATLLAQEGFTADSSALSRDGGFLDLYSAGTDINLSQWDPMGDSLYIIEKGIHLKKYPCCHYTHAAIEATINLVTKEDINPNEIKNIHVRGSPGAIDAANIEDPGSGLEGKFSMHFLLASAVVHRGIQLDTFVDENINNSQIRELMDKVSFSINSNRSYGSLSADLTIETKCGDQHVDNNAKAPGLAGINPLTESELQKKFLMCSTRVLGHDSSTNLWELLQSLQSLDDISGVHDLMI